MLDDGTLVSFFLDSKAAPFKLAIALHVIKISNNLGEAKSLITHPATATHHRLTQEARAALGITDGMLRLAVGLDDTEDLIEDIAIGLATAGR
jgi:O-succinylhomoserine sulfhydrylase